MRIFVAARNGDAKGVTSALNDGEEINALNDSGLTALMIAARWGHINVARLLLEAGASPSIKSKFGQLPAEIADRYNHNEISELILSYEVDN